MQTSLFRLFWIIRRHKLLISALWLTCALPLVSLAQNDVTSKSGEELKKLEKSSKQQPIPLLTLSICLQKELLQEVDRRIAKNTWQAPAEQTVYLQQRQPSADALIATLTIYSQRTGETFDFKLCQAKSQTVTLKTGDTAAASPFGLQFKICTLVMSRQIRRAGASALKQPGAPKPDVESLKRIETEIADLDRRIKLLTFDFRNKIGKLPNLEGCSGLLKSDPDLLNSAKETSLPVDQKDQATNDEWFKQAGFYFMYEPAVRDPRNNQEYVWHYYVGVILERSDGSIVYQTIGLKTDDPDDLTSLKRAHKTGLYKRIVPGFETEFYIVTERQKFTQAMQAAEKAAEGNICRMPLEMIAVPVTFGLTKPCRLAAVRGWTAIEETLGR